MSRPEHTGPPELFYNEDEASKYAQSSRMMEVQAQLSERAIELLGLPEKTCFILDVGCGSGLSGECLSDAGHFWIGFDISQAMLNIAVEREEADGDVFLCDMGQGIPTRPGIFDGCISISALQWLCNADSTSHDPRRRLHTFFTSLYRTLARGAKAVFQWYPENASQIDMVTQQAMRCGFTGGLLVDFPHSTKARKYFLVLFAGFSGVMPKALGDGAAEDGVDYEGERQRKRKGRSGEASLKDWVLHKKARQRGQGKDVRPDSKFTARKRGPKF